MKPLLRDILARMTGGDQRAIRWFEALAGATIPEGGLSGQVLAKSSDDNFEVEWAPAGGVVEWDDIEGKPDFADVALTGEYADLLGIPLTFSPSPHAHLLSDLLESGATVGQIPQWNGAAWVPETVSSGAISGVATITVPSAALSHVETFAATGVLPASLIFMAIGAHDDDDENSPELLDISTISGRAGTDQITATLVFATPTSGPINLNWSAS